MNRSLDAFHGYMADTSKYTCFTEGFLFLYALNYLGLSVLL